MQNSAHPTTYFHDFHSRYDERLGDNLHILHRTQACFDPLVSVLVCQLVAADILVTDGRLMVVGELFLDGCGRFFGFSYRSRFAEIARSDHDQRLRLDVLFQSNIDGHER